MSCLGCYHFHPRGGNIGYCDIMDHIVTVNGECEDWEEEDWEEEYWEEEDWEEEDWDYGHEQDMS